MGGEQDEEPCDRVKFTMLTVVVFVALGVRSKNTFKFHARTCFSRTSFDGFWVIRTMAVLKKNISLISLGGSKQATSLL